MILVDTAEIGEICKALENPAVRGITTNPKLIAQAAGEEIIAPSVYHGLCERLCRFAGADRRIRHVMIQSIGAAAQTRDLAVACREQLGISGSYADEANLWIKLPPTLSDLRSVDQLRRLGCKTLVTAVFTPSQALMAMESGADGIAVYFGRLLKSDPEWEGRLRTIVEIVQDKQGLPLLASLAEPDLVIKSLAFSRDLTLPPALITGLMDAPLSLMAIKEFAGRIASD